MDNRRSFLKRQFTELREGGRFIFFRKSKTFLFLIMPAILVLPIVLLIRILRPFVLVRFGFLPSARIGDYSGTIELYLCEKEADEHSKRAIDIFYDLPHISNQQLKKMWSRTLRVSNLAHPLKRANQWLPGYERHEVLIKTGRQINKYLAYTKPHLYFTPEEERMGYEALRQMGVPQGAQFVCFYARDAAYLDTVLPYTNWRYHDYRDADIKTFIPAVEELVKRGYFAIRMGAVVKEPLNIQRLNIIDYAMKYRNDFLDIFLCAKCRFFLGTSAGLASVPMVFRRPIACVNFIPFEQQHTWDPNELFIPKKLWLRNEKRFMTFKEILESGAGRFTSREQYERFGIEVVDNSPEEIFDLAVERDERLKGTWRTTEDDEELQKRFWKIFKSSRINNIFLSRIGSKFLYQNKKLLEE